MDSVEVAFPPVPEIIPVTPGLWGGFGANFYQDRAKRLVGVREIGTERRQRLMATCFARRAWPTYATEHPGDLRPLNCINIVEKFVEMQATSQEAIAARAIAFDAAMYAVTVNALGLTQTPGSTAAIAAI
jgi:hypothetical protein